MTAAAHKPTYMSWKGAKQRCSDPNHKHYHRYGGRGITFHAGWNKYADFLADMGERPDGLTLDRIKNDKGYEPGNCQWASRKAQIRNRDLTTRYDFDGESLPLAEIAERLCVPLVNLRRRLERGWSPEEAFSRALGRMAQADEVGPDLPAVARGRLPAAISEKPPCPIKLAGVVRGPDGGLTRLQASMVAMQAHKLALLASGLTPDQIANRAPRPDFAIEPSRQSAGRG